MVQTEWHGIPTPQLDGFTGFIPPEGTGSYGVCLCGEAGGEQEARAGRPFVEQAPAGSVLSRLLKRAGLERDSFVISNSVWSRPPGNYLDGARYEGEAVRAYAEHRSKLFDLYRPRVIVALGGVALRTLTNYGGKGASITNVQGYVLDSSQWDGVHVIGALHPSAILRGEQRMSGVVIWALQRAMDIARNGFVRKPTRYVTHAGLDEALAFERGYRPERDFLSYDIETAESSNLDEEELEDKDEAISYQITRVSFCYSGTDGYAISIPWQPPYIDIAKRLLSSNGAKRVWNGNFDNPRLAAAGVPVQGRIYDCMWLWKHLQPTLPRSLGFVAPFYDWTGEPWKHTSHAEPERYSAQDAHALQQIGDGLTVHLRQKGIDKLCERHVVDLGHVLDKMSKNGLPYSAEQAKVFEAELLSKLQERDVRLQSQIPAELRRPKQKAGYKKLPKELIGLDQRPFKVLGQDLTKEEAITFTSVQKYETYQVTRWCLLEPFNPGSPGQSGQMADFVKHYGYKIGTNRKTKKGTVDDDTLKKLFKRVIASKKPRDIEFRGLLQLCREIKQLNTVLDTYVQAWKPGRDGRIHSTPGFWGSMFRISWRRPNISATIQDKDEGSIAKGFRKSVTAREGRTLLEADWKSMEAVLVAYFAGDKDYDRLARLGVHDYLTCHILVDRGLREPSTLPDLGWPDADLRRLFKEVKKEFPSVRDDAKHCIHGISYGMTAHLMSDMYEMKKQDAQRLIDMFFGLFPKVRDWQKQTLDRASREARLTNPFGYSMPFWEVYRWDSKYQRWALGEDAKSAIAFLPRDTGAAMLKEVLLRLDEKHGLTDAGILLASTHDSVLTEPELGNDLERVARILHAEMTAPVPQLAMSDGSCLSIPVELKQGASWHESLMSGYELT